MAKKKKEPVQTPEIDLPPSETELEPTPEADDSDAGQAFEPDVDDEVNLDLVFDRAEADPNDLSDVFAQIEGRLTALESEKEAYHVVQSRIDAAQSRIDAAELAADTGLARLDQVERKLIDAHNQHHLKEAAIELIEVLRELLGG